MGADVETGMLHRLGYVLLVVAALVAVNAPALPAVAAESSGVFVDDDRSRYEAFINAAGQLGLVRGCNPPENTLFCPHDTVTRADMAVMLDRAIDLPSGSGDPFTDDDGLVSEPAIAALAEAGVTSGCDDGLFCPARILTRGELASFLTSALDWDSESLFPYVDLEDSPFGAPLAMLGRLSHIEPCDPPVGRRMCPDRAVTRDEAVYALASAIDIAPKASGAGQPAPKVDFSDGFETLDLWDGRSVSSRNRVALIEDGFNGRGLRVRIARSSHFGADFKLDLEDVAGTEPELLYFRYMLRLDPDWSPTWSGKLPGFSGVYGSSGKGGHRSSAASPGWSARLQFFGTHRNDPRARLGYYVYHLGQERRYGDSMMWNEAGKLVPGEWYCIEGEVDMNTPGLADGALRAWVDETPAFDAAGIEFRRPDEPNIRIESFWFNVYYGGKPVAEEEMGLTIDEVAVDTARIGCDAGPGLDRAARGDVTGDGFADRLSWGTCPGGTCFLVRRTDPSGRQSTDRLGDGAWFSLDTHRLGLAVGDFDGDRRHDVIYRGRCANSRGCWRVHRSVGSRLQAGEDWGDGARIDPAASGLVVGDWDGDGLDDLAYRGICGSEAHPCWRVHRSNGNRLTEPGDWGSPPPAASAIPTAADVNGDGSDDLVFTAPCGEDVCWFAQRSSRDGFTKAERLGRVRDGDSRWARWFDVDADGAADLLTARHSDDGSAVELRTMGSERLAEAITMANFNGEVADVLVRRSQAEELPEVLVIERCEEQPGCVHRLLASDESFITVMEHHRRRMMVQLFTGEHRLS